MDFARRSASVGFVEEQSKSTRHAGHLKRQEGLSVATRVTIAFTSVVSCLFIYPLVHECGHWLPAALSGAEVTEFVWTPLIGRPHVGLNNVTGEAMPWVDAGGMLLPTLVGTVLIAIWICFPSRRPMRLWRWWLLVPGGVLLLGNLGLFFEVILPSNRLDHMEGLAHQIAGSGMLGVLVELSPAFWTCFMLASIVRRTMRGHSTETLSLVSDCRHSKA